MKHIPELDGVRGCAIGMVMFYHFVFLFTEAPPATFWSYVQAAGRLVWSGVDLFFVLSGFLIGGILLDSRGSTGYYRNFYTRRFFRIVPIYIVMLGVTWLFVRLAHPVGQRLPWLSYILFVQNFWMAKAQALGFFAVTWSLAVEEQFYLMLPSVVRFVPRRALVYTLAAGIVAAPCLRMMCFHFWPLNSYLPHVMMPCRADALLLGVLAAVWMRDPQTKRIFEANGSALLALLLMFAGGAVLITKYDLHGFYMLSVGYTWLAGLYLCVVLYAVTQPQSRLAGALRMRWLMALGTISYGVYLVHWQMIVSMLRLIPSKILALAAAAVLTIAICAVSWHYFEKPLVQHGNRYR